MVIVAATSGGCKRSSDTVTPHPIAYYQGVETGGSNPPGTSRSSSAGASPSSTLPPLPMEKFDDGVTVRLRRVAAGGDTISFGLPLPPRAVVDPATIRVSIGSQKPEARVTETIADHDANGRRNGTLAVSIQLPSSVMTGPDLDVVIRFRGDGANRPIAGAAKTFAETSEDSPETVLQATRTLVQHPEGALIQTPKPEKRVLFMGREARVVATYPEGYLAATRVLGGQTTARQAAQPAFAGLRFLSDQAIGFGTSAVYEEPYALNPDPESVPDPKVAFEGWLYDRCATMLLLYTHSGDERFLRHGLRSCSWYARQIKRDGPNAGIFAGKPEPDTKYSHARGLYAYYALTGDEEALGAVRAIAEMWLADKMFVAPYRDGHLRGPDKLWTERLLGTSLEGLLYGHRMTGEKKYLDAVRALVDTAFRHVTGDAKALATINPGANFPPQGCFIHNALQQAEGNPDEPWCSAWMSDLVIDPLLRYQEQTGDNRPDVMFVQLSRFLRDVGTAYFRKGVLDDTFLAPSVCDDPTDIEDRRRLVPTYGAGVLASGKRKLQAEYTDYEHCPDATALTAAALRALRRTGEFDKNPVGPFPSEGEALVAMHAELASCAERTLQEGVRPKRSPDRWGPRELAAGLSDPTAFFKKNKIGYPQRNLAPQRKLSWWFNSSLEQYTLLAEAKVSMPALRPGRVTGPSCKR